MILLSNVHVHTLQLQYYLFNTLGTIHAHAHTCTSQLQYYLFNTLSAIHVHVHTV